MFSFKFLYQTGPNWKSLSAPAILPISVDYFPPQTKIDLNFTISQYSINISDFEHHNVSTTKHLLMEMVRQRITQDFQLVYVYAYATSFLEKITDFMMLTRFSATIHTGLGQMSTRVITERNGYHDKMFSTSDQT